jgi:SOS-response transcriptional repressor LexA
VTAHDARRADAILETIQDFTTEYGHPPSLRDLVPRVGLASTSAVHYHLRRLLAGGFVRQCSCGCGRWKAVPLAEWREEVGA